MESHQLDLFPAHTAPILKQEQLVMNLDALLKWKQQIFDYQQRTTQTKPVEQVKLFDLALSHCDPDQIDPFTLQLVLMSFYGSSSGSEWVEATLTEDGYSDNYSLEEMKTVHLKD